MHDKFHIHPTTGLVSTRIVFDFESRSRYNFAIKATDAGNLFSVVRVQVDIESRDEYEPQFAQKFYKFIIPSNAASGYIIGRVEAIDKDQGKCILFIVYEFEFNLNLIILLIIFRNRWQSPLSNKSTQ